MQLFHCVSLAASVLLSVNLAPSLGCQSQKAEPPSAGKSAQAADKSAQAAGKGEQAPTKEKHPAGHRFGFEKAPQRKEGVVRLAAYNIENVFDNVDDPSLSGEWDDMKMVTSEARCKALAAAIHELDADILAVEEIESLDALKWFRDTYLNDMRYEFAESRDVGYYRGVEQGVLSRFPLKSVEVYPDESLADVKREGPGWTEISGAKAPAKFQRSPLKVEVELPGGCILTVFGVHLKAGGATENDAHREAESLQIREYVDKLLAANSQADIVVLGDFNASPGDRPIKLQLKEAEVSAAEAKSSNGKAAGGSGSDGKSAAGKGSDGKGNMVSGYDFRDTKASRDAYRTHVSDRAIDYIVMSPGLASDCVEGSFFVLGTLYPGDKQQDEMRKWLKDRKGPEPEKPAGYASDHYPIAIDFRPCSTSVPAANKK